MGGPSPPPTSSHVLWEGPKLTLTPPLSVARALTLPFAVARALTPSFSVPRRSAELCSTCYRKIEPAPDAADASGTGGKGGQGGGLTHNASPVDVFCSEACRAALEPVRGGVRGGPAGVCHLSRPLTRRPADPLIFGLPVFSFFMPPSPCLAPSPRCC